MAALRKLALAMIAVLGFALDVHGQDDGDTAVAGTGHVFVDHHVVHHDHHEADHDFHLHVGPIYAFGTFGVGMYAFPYPGVVVFATPWAYGYAAYPPPGWYVPLYTGYVPSYLRYGYGFGWYGYTTVAPLYGYPYAWHWGRTVAGPLPAHVTPRALVHQYRYRSSVYTSLMISILRHQRNPSHGTVPVARPAWGHFGRRH